MNHIPKYYFPVRLQDEAEKIVKQWGKLYKHRTYRSMEGESQCIEVINEDDTTNCLIIISDTDYLYADAREKLIDEERFMLFTDRGEYIIYAPNRKDATKQARYMCDNWGIRYRMLRAMNP